MSVAKDIANCFEDNSKQNGFEFSGIPWRNSP
jgi:hypothetical protein